jgi:hypothetical protein
MLVRSFFIAIFILLAALFFWLIHGIEVDKLDIGRYKIDGLYIKLDKKLTLKAKEITLPKSKAAPSFSRVDKTFDQIKYLLTFFDTIMLEKINFENNHLTLLYADDVLYITSDIYEIAGNIERKGTKLIADVSLLYLKKDHVTISGKLSYDLHNNELETGGKFDAFGIKGHFRALKRKDEVIYALNTEPFGDLKPLITRIHMPAVIESWVIDKVRAKQYKVAYIKGKAHVKGQDVTVDFASLKGKVRFEDVTIRYKDGIPPANAKTLMLGFQNGNLTFDLTDPRYQGRDLNGTRVVIKHIVGPMSPVLILDLHVVTPMDEKVEEILQAYHLKIPVTHTGKMNRVHVNLKIPLGKQHKKLKATVDVALAKGVLRVDDIPLHVTGGSVHYEAGMVKVKGIGVDEPWYQGSVDGEIMLAKQKAVLMLDVKKAQLGEKSDPLLVVQNRKIPLDLFYGTPIRVSLPTLDVKVVKQKQSLAITLEDMQKIIPFLKRNMIGLTGGKLEIKTNDLKRYTFQGTLKKDICFFYEKSDVCYPSIPVEGSVDIKSGNLDLYAFSKRFHLNLAKGVVQLKNLNIDLKRFLEEQRKLQKSAYKRKRLLDKKFVIMGKNSHLRYGSYRLVTDSYDIEVSPNGNIKAIGSIAGDVVKLTRNGDNFVLQALRVKDKMLHPLINFTGLKNGRYSLKKEGNPDKVMKGRIIIEGGILSDFKAYNNTLAFLNTLPALATLSNPGFSNKGFKIKEGVIEYTMTPQKITFTSVYLKGNSATVLGKGTVDLKTKKLDINLAILTAREFGKVVGKIPLLGYILMGDDNSLTVGLKITGTLENPKVNTSVAEDIVSLPLQILKRTITAPAHLGDYKQVAPTNLPPKGGEVKPKQKPAKPSRTPIPSITKPKPSSASDHAGELF